MTNSRLRDVDTFPRGGVVVACRSGVAAPATCDAGWLAALGSVRSDSLTPLTA